MKSMNEAVCEIKSQELFDKIIDLVGFLETSFQEERAAHQVEEGVWKRMLAMGRCAYGAYLSLFGDGDVGERAVLEDGRKVRRLEGLHRRGHQSVFGPFVLERVVYGSREGQKIEYIPFDERLALPEGKNSYLLQDWDQAWVVEMPYATVSAGLSRILGFTQSVHTLERNQREMAEAEADFWQDRPIPPAGQEGLLLVCTADGKGVPIRGGAGVVRGTEAPTTGGMRPGSKKMALIGAVYTVDPHVRTPEEVLEALFREAPPSEALLPSRPKPLFKYVRAALERDEADSSEPQTRDIFDWMAQQAAQRNPEGHKPVILLMDGQQSLWNAGWAYLPGENVTEILDLLHATGYLWEAAHLFHPKDNGAARAFVKTQALRILRGDIGTVIHSLRWQSTRHKFKGKRLEALERIRGYFRNNIHRMAYDVYLENGFPIASGVIEGACRCVVKDRMERSGMRWVMSGARAMLGMRCIYLSGLWEAFITYRIQRESRRLYRGIAANDPDFSRPLAA